MDNQETNYLKAQERVKVLKEFYNHLFVFIIVNIFLAGANYYTNQWTYPWFLWVIGGWGIGIIFDALKAFQVTPMFNKDWEERKIQAFMEEEDKQKWE